MLIYALAVLVVGALGGLILATFVLRGRFPPWVLSLLHAGLGVVGLTLVALSLLNDAITTVLIVAVALLVTTALTGLYLASRHYRHMRTPKLLVFAHASFALTFLLLLSGTVFGIV
jgi:hypothetical protein